MIKGMKHKYLIYSLPAVFFWASSSVVIRLTFGSITIMHLSTVRSWLGALILLIFCLIKKIPPPKKRDIPLFILSGVMGFALFSLCFNTGFLYLTAATGNVVMAVVPVITALIAQILLKERIRPLGWVFICVSFSGILVLILWNGVLSINIGVFWILAAAFLNSVYSLLQRHLVRSYSALQSCAFSLFAGALAYTPFLPGAVKELAAITPMVAIAIAYLGILGGGIGYLLWSQGLALVKRTADATNLLYLPPFIASILAFAMFRELPDWGTVIGGVIILFGLWMYQKKA